VLETAPNVWLEAVAENNHVGLAIMRSDFVAGLDHARRGLDLAQESGAATVIRAALGNFGNLYYMRGEFERAATYFDDAMKAFPVGENAYSGLETLARARLLQDRLDECAGLLDQIDESIRSPNGCRLFVYRHTLLTKAQLLQRREQWGEATLQLDRALELAAQTGDDLLAQRAVLIKADLLQETGDIRGATTILEDVVPRLGTPLDLHAHYERILACALERTGQRGQALTHLARAERLYESVGSVPGSMELDRGWRVATSVASKVRPDSASDDTIDTGAATALQSVCAILVHPNRAELVARELVDLLGATRCTQSLAAVACTREAKQEVLSFTGADLSAHEAAKAETIFIGIDRGRTIELRLHRKDDIDSSATISAFKLLVATIQELQHGRMEREERSTLWPADELPVENGHAVIAGHMRELMMLVQRVARTNIGVLISGESGTGKEIIARAIHDYSDRAQKPFVPVNCASVPRELMESQLFGHRRGAFTGADRDYAGFIRAARDGTLFLDEVGELSLDLQPKLLRFLESGEIAPLGETAPLTVNVRVLAATNKNLEELVREGKFREDLFYRLNVVPLTIRPLRERRDEIPRLVQHFVDRAAVEFKKGHPTVTEETMERLLLYRWPGNVRQLQHEVQRIVALAEPDSTLLPHMISEEILGALPLLRPIPSGREMAVSLNEKLPSAIARIECELIKVALRDNRGKVDAAAKALGISRKGLYLKRQRLGL